jgi:hypothetical protein
MEELEQHFAQLEARIAALEQHAHSTHTLDASALDAITTHVIGCINEHLRAVFGRREPPKSEPAAAPTETQSQGEDKCP